MSNPEQKNPVHSPMPSRPSLPPPMPPKGAKPMKVKTLSQSGFDMVTRKHHSKKFLIIAFAIALMLLLGVAVLIAKTGVYRIPFLSSVYHERPVTRVVSADAIEPRDLLNRVNDRLRSSVSTSTKDVKISITEQELTGALKGALQTSLKRPGVIVDGTQIVSLADGLELIASVRTETMSVRMLAKAVPVVQDGRVKLEVKELYLGSLPVPPNSLAQMERLVIGSEIGSFEAKAGNYLLKDVVLKDGSVELVFSSSTSSR